MSERIIRKYKEKLTLKIRDNSVEDREATSPFLRAFSLEI